MIRNQPDGHRSSVEDRESNRIGDGTSPAGILQQLEHRFGFIQHTLQNSTNLSVF